MNAFKERLINKKLSAETNRLLYVNEYLIHLLLGYLIDEESKTLEDFSFINALDD